MDDANKMTVKASLSPMQASNVTNVQSKLTEFQETRPIHKSPKLSSKEGDKQISSKKNRQKSESRSERRQSLEKPPPQTVAGKLELTLQPPSLAESLDLSFSRQYIRFLPSIQHRSGDQLSGSDQLHPIRHLSLDPKILEDAALMPAHSPSSNSSPLLKLPMVGSPVKQPDDRKASGLARKFKLNFDYGEKLNEGRGTEMREKGMVSESGHEQKSPNFHEQSKDMDFKFPSAKEKMLQLQSKKAKEKPAVPPGDESSDFEESDDSDDEAGSNSEEIDL